VLSIAALLTVHSAIDSANRQTEALRQQAQLLEQENERLQSYVAEKDTINEIIRIAQERLGLVKPDSIIIQPE
jgi:cell division protein FtsB